jgi:hypothetical protein
VQKHFGAIVSVVLSLVTFAVTFAVTRYRVDEQDVRLRRVESDGASGRETRWIVDQHTKDLADAKTELRRQGDAIVEIRTDVKLIAAWVRQQQDREARASLK